MLVEEVAVLVAPAGIRKRLRKRSAARESTHGPQVLEAPPPTPDLLFRVFEHFPLCRVNVAKTGGSSSQADDVCTHLDAWAVRCGTGSTL